MTTNTSEKYYEAYGGMPIPPVKDNMEIFEAGAVSIGVEFRVLNDAVVSALGLAEIAASNAYPTLDDHGVSIHVFVRTEEGNFERLRFDCFRRDPHYHYLSVRQKWQHVIHIDPNVTGDPAAWALDMLRTRLVPMMLRADVPDAALLVDYARIEDILPLVTEAVFRARFHTDNSKIENDAKARGIHDWDTSEGRDWNRHSSL
jgi:hypothetical protein